MTWATNVPRGDLLPRNERPRFQGNWSYIQTEMRDDHYWNEDANKDGHHRKIGVDDIANTGVTLTGVDPSDVDDGTVGMYYARVKTSTEASDAANQLANPYYTYRNSGDSASYFKQLGFSAMVTFRVSGSAIVANNGNNWDYQHNVSTVTRNSTGLYTIAFTNALPNANYVVLATCQSTIAGNGGTRFAMIESSGKAAGSVQIKTMSNINTTADISSLSVVVIGA